tara:strand:+ start:1642 stop:2223 length:582 start_codon:yes stop_codon:yes gene_type:complete
LLLFLQSCSTIQSTVDSVSEAGSYVYDSIKFWEDDDEEEISEAIIIEEAIEVPDFAIPNENLNSQQIQQYMPRNSVVMDPIYRSARQYYYVSPNGSPLPAPPPPPFPQYSIEQNSTPFNENYTTPNVRMNNDNPQNLTNSYINQSEFERFENNTSQAPNLTPDEEMELFGIENNCIRVVQDYINGGYMCDDFD